MAAQPSLGADAVHAVHHCHAPMAQDLDGQRPAVAFGGARALVPFVRARQLKVIAIAGSCRIAAFPEVRTFAKQVYTNAVFQLNLACGWCWPHAPASLSVWSVYTAK